MARPCMASSGTSSLIFTDDGGHDGCSKMNSQVLQKHFVCHFKKDATKLTGGSGPKHTAETTKELIRGKKRPHQSSDLNPIEHAFYLLKKRLKGVTPQHKHQLKEAAVKAWKSIRKKKNAKVW